MTRHLTALKVPQLAAPPAAPAAGYVALYADPDGRVHRRTSDGAAGPVSPWRSTVLGSDVLLPAGASEADIPGLSITVGPGLYQVRSVLNVRIDSPVRLVGHLPLLGPTADLVAIDTILFYVDEGEAIKLLRTGYGNLLDNGYWVSTGSGIQVRADATLHVTGSGPVRIRAQAENRITWWAFDSEDDFWEWISGGGEFAYVTDQGHDSDGAAQCVPDGESERVELHQ